MYTYNQDFGPNAAEYREKRPNIRKLVLIIGILLLFTAGSKINQSIKSNSQTIDTYPSVKITATAQDNASEKIIAVDEQSQVIEVVKKASPAVVSIIASAEVPKIEKCSNLYQDGTPSSIEQFFGFPMSTYCQNGTELQRIGAGSGFIVSENGYIITNRHVVENTDAEYTVVLNDTNNYGKKITAEVVARDEINDVAVLKINYQGLPYINFGDSDNLQVGQTTVAIGYSLGQFDNTVSKGVVSGLYRSIVAGGTLNGKPEKLSGLIQTDAAINPGNSGGPLLDLSGNVIGMNVAMADAQSIGFAIPINIVKKDFDQVVKTGKISPALEAY